MVIQLDADVALGSPRARQHVVGGVGAQHAQALGVLAGDDVVEEREVREVVDVDLGVQGDDDAVAAQAHRPHLAAE